MKTNLKSVTTTENIFDTDNVSDLPSDMQDKIARKRQPNNLGSRIVLLLNEMEDGFECSYKEIWVALYRKYGREAKECSVWAACSKLKQEGILKTRKINGITVVSLVK